MDDYTTASELPADASKYFENIILRDNKRPRTRPGAETLNAAPAAAHATRGLKYFQTPAYAQLLAAQNSKIWKWEGASWAEVAGWAPQDNRVAMEQLVDKVLLSDGSGNLQSYDGAAFTDLGNIAGAAGDPPVGTTILRRCAGRIFAAGKSDEPDTLWASSLLGFDRGQWDHTKFKIRIGGGEGKPITGLLGLQNSTLVVFKEGSTYLVAADPTANTAAAWNIGDPLSEEIGCVGLRACCGYGNDGYFVARDGVRTVRRMAAAAGQYEVSAPISVPIQTYIDRINWDHADQITARNYKELVLFAVPLDSSTTNNAVLVYNARLGVWLGRWTGWTPNCWEVTRFGGTHRLVFGETPGLVRQWKDWRTAGTDSTYQDDGAAIPTKLWTRAMLFGEPENDKDGYHAEVRFNTSNAVVTITAVGDDATLRQWQKDVRQQGPTFPVTLPFTFASATSTPTRRGLRGCRAFNEMYLKIESTSGWWELRNVTVSAYLNMLQNQ